MRRLEPLRSLRCGASTNRFHVTVHIVDDVYRDMGISMNWLQKVKDTKDLFFDAIRTELYADKNLTESALAAFTSESMVITDLAGEPLADNRTYKGMTLGGDSGGVAGGLLVCFGIPTEYTLSIFEQKATGWWWSPSNNNKDSGEETPVLQRNLKATDDVHDELQDWRQGLPDRKKSFGMKLNTKDSTPTAAVPGLVCRFVDQFWKWEKDNQPIANTLTVHELYQKVYPEKIPTDDG